jgi:hypothetical protein
LLAALQVLKQSDCADTLSFLAEFPSFSKVKPKHHAVSVFGFLRLRTAIFRMFAECFSL